MEFVKFVGKVRSGGTTAVITIPKPLMKYENIQIGDKVKVMLRKKEVENDENNGKDTGERNAI